jgi:protein-tyrosine phosphatase/O-acetyl-ADP-ribose deacetylase (regulator of RNase III)
MQNNVFEIPIDSGFTKNCQIIKTNEITDTSDLFDDNDLIKSNFSEQYLGRLFIVEVAAPDRRDKNSKLGSLFDASKVDRGCSYDSARRAIKDEIAETIIANAIEYTLQQAIKNNVDVILLNAFGCGAFNNDPTQVASIFSESLSKYRRELSGKTIYFVDLCPIKCMQFGQIFSDRLNNQFNINPYRIGNTSINLLANRFEYRLSDEALVQSTTKEHLSHKNIIPINLSSSVHIGKEILILEQHYYNAILQALERRYSTIRFPLLGTGNNKFYMGDSIYAFVAAVQKISAAYDLSHIRICLHIDDTHKYSQAIRTLKLIQNDFTKEASLKKEIQKFFTISSPTTTKIINFAGGRWQAGKHTQWDKIIEHLWLGVIPTRGNVMTLQEMIPSLKLVVSVVEDFELASEGTRPYVLMQTPLEWEELGIAHQHLVVDDMKKADDFPSYELIKTIVKMHYYIQQGHDVLVHCKAGRSRSATIVLLYLMIFTDENNETIQDVSAINLNNIFDSLMEKHSYLKECRPRASLHEHHYDAICKALELIKRNPKLLTPKPAYYEIKAEQLADLSIADQIHAYLATKGAHSEIMQLSWFKQLKIISIQNPDQREEIQAFLNSVKAKDGKWLSDLFSNRAPDPIIHFRNQVCELLKIQLNSSEIVAYLQESSFTFKK